MYGIVFPRCISSVENQFIHQTILVFNTKNNTKEYTKYCTSVFTWVNGRRVRKILSFGSTHLYRLAESAEISLQIGYSPIGEKSPPPESQLRPLTAVPEDLRKQIWDEATKKLKRMA